MSAPSPVAASVLDTGSAGVRGHSTRKAIQPTRLKPSTPSVAKTPARTKAASDTRRSKPPGARDGHDDAPSDQEGVAELVNTTGGSMAGDY